jgi:hypothetical protein
LITGGVADALCKRGTLPLYYALVRYWSDHPRLDQIAQPATHRRHRRMACRRR